MLDSLLKTNKCLIIILTLINLVSVRQLKMKQEMNSVFQTWEGGRKLVELSEIYMLDTCLCVEVIQFQIGIKLFCIHFT